MRELEILFLGTGTSHGVPMIGCDCAVCTSEDARDKRLRSSIQVRTPEMVIQVDTTPDFRTQCLRENIRHIDAVVYTHSHTDHILGFDDLRRFCDMQEKDMPVYGSPRTISDLKRVFDYAFSGDFRFKNYIRPDPHVIEGPFRLGETEITPVSLPHGRMDTTGLIFSRGGRKLFAYFTDCAAVPDEVIAVTAGVEVLVLDALRYVPHPTHMSVEQALNASARIGPQRTYFTHLSHDLGQVATEKQLPENVRLAYDGLRICV
jgi:phosphoribosyl 1,2-cyclic phosphate phosphodiesterase